MPGSDFLFLPHPQHNCLSLNKKSNPTGVDNLNIDNPKSSQRYNLMGQPVGNNYKGIVIQNGKKIIVK